MIIEMAVTEHTAIVSRKTSPQPHDDWRTGWSAYPEAWATIPYPVPASFELRPLAIPYLTASLTVAPANPPTPAMGVNALLNISPKA